MSFTEFVKEDKSNQKQFKQFDESLFKAYINKFSDEDLSKVLEIIISLYKGEIYLVLDEISNLGDKLFIDFDKASDYSKLIVQSWKDEFQDNKFASEIDKNRPIENSYKGKYSFHGRKAEVYTLNFNKEN